MTTTKTKSPTSFRSGTTLAKTLRRIRQAVRLFVSRSQLGPVNNYCAGDHTAA